MVAIHGGSLEVHVGLPGRHAIKPAIASQQALETERGYGELATYEAFAKRVWELRDALLAVLERYKAEGKSVYAFGAPAKGATLLNSFGITPELVQVATERNPMKIGMLMPGSRLPIVAEEGAVPDAFLVLAWNFIDEFVRREQAYLAGGGEFIVPVPELKVIGREAVASRAGA